MAHEPVEVVRTGGPGIDLIIDHLRLLAEILPQGLRHASRLFEWRAIGHVDDYLELTLVVEGEHFYANPLQRDKSDRREQQQYDTAEKHPAAARVADERVHHPAIQTSGPAFSLMPGLIATACMFPQQPQCRPRRN